MKRFAYLSITFLMIAAVSIYFNQTVFTQSSGNPIDLLLELDGTPSPTTMDAMTTVMQDMQPMMVEMDAKMAAMADTPGMDITAMTQMETDMAAMMGMMETMGSDMGSMMGSEMMDMTAMSNMTSIMDTMSTDMAAMMEMMDMMAGTPMPVGTADPSITATPTHIHGATETPTASGPTPTDSHEHGATATPIGGGPTATATATHVHVTATPVVTTTPGGPKDIIAPTGTAHINHGASETNSTGVTLSLQATDNPDGTGVKWIRITELVFHPDMGWVEQPVLDPVHASHHQNTWLPYQSELEYHLSPKPGVKYLAVWFADGAWNISQPAIAKINLVSGDVSLSHPQVHPYRYTFQAGQNVTIDVHSVAGDPDLYVWFPHNTGAPDLISNSSSGSEQVSFTASHNGEFLVEVQSHQDSQYMLVVTLDGPSATPGIDPVKSVPTAPTVPDLPATFPTPHAGLHTFLPLTVR